MRLSAKPLFLLSLACVLPGLAQAGADEDLIAARDAARAKRVTQAAELYARLPANYPLKDYPAYWLALQALEQNDEAPAQAFLTRAKEGLMPERVRNEWLKKLGERESWTLFASEWSKLPPEGRDEESSCYGQLMALQRESKKPDNLDHFLDSKPSPDGCNRLIEAAARKDMLTQDWLWRRVRLLLAGNYLTQARALAATSLPLDGALLNKPALATADTAGGQEAILYDIMRKARSDVDGAASALARHEASLSRDRSGFGWGQLALLSARKLQTSQARQWYAKADPVQLTDEQWEWWARSTLREQDWPALSRLIAAMPVDVAARPAWSYWNARALQSQGKPTEASALLAQASQGHQYYAILAQEELGNALSPAVRVTPPDEAEQRRIQTLPAVRRSLALFNLAQFNARADFRTDAQKEWRWAMRDLNDNSLLAAAEVARKEGFYDMAIYSAERTKEEHDFSLRYLTPYRTVTQRYAQQLEIDPAWVYGLIRQESRFITAAHSGVGAAGLMQLMPATAKWAAKKIGLTNFAVNDIETNVQLGTWYLRYVLDKLSGNEVMATAAYNAGPGRARAWQADKPLEGLIYAETIPFSETRDYVQKVMANAAYYSTGFGHSNLSLKARMGTIPAR